ncbi:MAG: PqqD family protein [Cyanobacteria bacterium P01_F01_bin.143]
MIKTPIIEENSIIIAAQHPRSSEVESEMVIIDLKIQEFYGLNPVAATVWKLIQEPYPVAELLKEIIKTYDVAATQCREDLMSFLNELAANNLIEVMAQS